MLGQSGLIVVVRQAQLKSDSLVAALPGRNDKVCCAAVKRRSTRHLSSLRQSLGTWELECGETCEARSGIL